MIKFYSARSGVLQEAHLGPDSAIPPDVVWADLLRPTLEEEQSIERGLGINIPVREELAEIEASSRLYVRNGATFMTATLISRADDDKPQSDAVTFAGKRLVTVRYCEPRAFDIFIRRTGSTGGACPPSAEGILIGLLETIVDRAADHLERVGLIVSNTSRDIFEPLAGKWRKRNFELLLRQIGAEGDFTSNVRESLVSIARLTAFLTAVVEPRGEKRAERSDRAHLKTLQRDIQWLTDHSSYLSDKITFLLDATLGMISIEQNDIIKVFSVAAVAFLPPTLIASIYGMNFQFMPELGWQVGYPLAIALMVLSAVIPYLYFRKKGWL
jgi:magnesium transporter